MPDNFDLNVARRKPNVAKRQRPIHPWDVPVSPPDSADGVDDDGSRDRVPSETVSDDAFSDRARTEPDTGDVDDSSDGDTAVDSDSDIPGQDTADTSVKKRTRVSAPSVPVADKPRARERTQGSPVGIPAQQPGKVSDLSNTINIHSNFCKLDNDVSDHLFPRLSPSAQSVYLRLYRQSFGWNRNWAAESLPKLSKSCNLSLQTIRKAIKELEIIGCIRKEFSDYHKATVYRVLLPSELGMTKTRLANDAGLNSDIPSSEVNARAVQSSVSQSGGAQESFTDINDARGVRNLEGDDADSGGQESFIQSLYFTGASIYVLLESGGALPKNIQKYITHIQLANAVSIIDSFYDSIGFSVVSRAAYRKSLLDYFDLVKSGFTSDDIRYAVRWTFMNSRTRPESFSLIKHTMHLAMDDMIRDLKGVSGEADAAKKKREALAKNAQWEQTERTPSLSSEALKTWAGVVDELKGSLNEHSYKAFIEPLKLVQADERSVTLSAPPDSVSWVIDHYRDVIAGEYERATGNAVTVAIE